MQGGTDAEQLEDLICLIMGKSERVGIALLFKNREKSKGDDSIGKTEESTTQKKC